MYNHFSLVYKFVCTNHVTSSGFCSADDDGGGAESSDDDNDFGGGDLFGGKC